VAGAGAGSLAAQRDSAVPALPPVIEAIRLRRHNVYAAEEARSFIPRLVNRFHFQTRAGVIQREILFGAGERYDPLLVAETERNLRRLGVFRRVQVDSVRADSGGVIVMVETQDAWSTKPEFTFRTTGGQLAYRISLIEENLFGTASRLSASYYNDPDRDAFLFAFYQPRLVAGRVGLSLFYDDRSDGYVFDGVISQPYLSLAGRNAWSLGVDTRDERILRYFEGAEAPGDTVRRLLDGVDAGYGWALRGDSRGYVRLAFSGRLWRDDFLGPDDEDLDGTRLAYGVLWGTVDWRRSRYVKVRGFRSNRVEDVDLSSTARFGLGLTPKAFGYDDDGVVPSLTARTGAVFKDKGFAYVDLTARGRFTGAGLDSGTVQTAATVAYLPNDRHLALLHGWVGWLHNPRPGGEFDFGFGVGPRAYRLHAFTGDRGVFTTAEYRYMLAEDFLTIADVGVAAFVDWGGAWYSGERRRTAWDFGLGLRVGTSRSTDLLLNRIDLGYRAGNDREVSGWVLVIGKGFVFSSSGVVNR